MHVVGRCKEGDEIRQALDDDDEGASGRHGRCHHLPRAGAVDHNLVLVVERADVVQADAVAVGCNELYSLGEGAGSCVAGAEGGGRDEGDGCADLVRGGVGVVLGLEGGAPADVDAAVEGAFEVVTGGGEGEEAEGEELHEGQLLQQRLQGARAADVERRGDAGVQGVGTVFSTSSHAAAAPPPPCACGS